MVEISVRTLVNHEAGIPGLLPQSIDSTVIKRPEF